MADINKFIPFLIKWEAGVTDEDLDNRQLFEKARESGWADDPDDAGGKTMTGVTIGTYTQYRKNKKLPAPTADDLKNISYDEWLEILKTMYWDRWKADNIRSQEVAEILVDWVWASGVNGIKRPQKLLGVKVDGIVGEKTLAAVNAADPMTLFFQIKNDRVKYIDERCKKRPVNEKYRKGWMNRLNDIDYKL